MSLEKRKIPFNSFHKLEYRLKILTRDPLSDVGTSVLCHFCQVWDREQKIGQKRKPARTTQYFKVPYRLEMYC